MKACFPIVGEKEYKDSISSTKQRQFVFTTPCIESVFISFVSISFNKLHVSVPTRTCIRVNGEIRVLNKFVLSALFVFKKIHGDIRVQQCVFTKPCIESVFISFVSFSFNKPHVSVPTRTCIRVRSVCQINSCYPRYYLPAVSGPSANLVFKTSRESIEIHHWSIPHCGQPQQFNIQHSKLNIALRASVCKKYSCHSLYSCSK